jgi:hypothetical protein
VIVAVLLLLVGHDSSTWLAVLALATVFALVTICGSDWYASLFMRRRPGVQRDPRRLMPLNEIRAALREIENDVDLEGIGEQSPKLRAEKLFKLHQYELKRYYDQTLRHSSAIFIVGIVCMFLGFAIIVASLVLLRDLPENAGTTTKIVIGALGAIGAILRTSSARFT